MKVQVNEAEHSQKELVFEIPYETFEETADKELDKLLPNAKIPGFRAGKVPRDIAKKHFSHRIKSQAIEQVINNAVQDGMTSNNITPLSQAYISDVVFEENKPITFKARVDVFPKVELNKYSGYTYSKAQVAVNDKDIDEALKLIQEREASFEQVSGRDTVKEGDIAVIDFEGKKDGVAFEGGAAKNYSLNIGSGQFIPGFESGVEGMKIGETKDLNLKFPENYGAKDLAGKEVVFTVTVNDIKEKKLPAIDDEFAKDVDPNSSTLEELKGKLKKGLQTEVDRSIMLESFGELLEQIVKDNNFEVPYTFVKEQSERLAYNSLSQYYQMGIDPEQMGINFESMAQRFIPQAENQVKQAIIINEIAKKEGIEVKEEDITSYLSFHAELQGRTAEELKKELEGQMQIEAVRNDILGNKVFEFLEGINSADLKKMSKKEYEEYKKQPKASKKEEKESKEEVKEEVKKEGAKKSTRSKKVTE